jgi:membrane protein
LKPAPPALWQRWEPVLRELGHYVLQSEVHTYSFSVAANAILSFFPFVVLLLSVTLNVLHSRRMYEVVVQLLQDYLPTNQDFVIRNLKMLAENQHGVQLFGIVMLLITSTGVFLPLEVALNRVWGFPKNRSYLWNQIVSLGLALGVGMLALGSVAVTALNHRALEIILLGHNDNYVFHLLAHTMMKVAAVFASVAIFFLIYWILPNGKISVRSVAPAAVLTGFCWEAAKNLYILILPWLNFKESYGPFSTSVTLIFYAFFSGMLLLAGARLSAAGHERRLKQRAAVLDQL